MASCRKRRAWNITTGRRSFPSPPTPFLCSGFFNNYENYVRYDDPRIVAPFRDTFTRLWTWSLAADVLDRGATAAEQHLASTRPFFGNLHAHFHSQAGGKLWDDGKPERQMPDGTKVAVETGGTPGEASRLAFEYARDQGQMDFLALTPHSVDDRPDDPVSNPSMSPEGYAELLESAAGEEGEESFDSPRSGRGRSRSESSDEDRSEV